MNSFKKLLILPALILTLLMPASALAMAYSPKCPDGSDRIYQDNASRFKSNNALSQFAVFNDPIPKSIDKQYGYDGNYDCPMTIENLTSGDRSMWKYYIAALIIIGITVAAAILTFLKLSKK